MLRIGILLPRSTLFPALGLDMLEGLKQSLKQQGCFDDIKLLTDNIGFGINEAEVYSKAEKMLLQEDADVVVLFADSKIAAMLQPLFTASNKLLIVVNFGANYPESWQAEPTTIIHSLNFCLHTTLTGKLAAAESGKQAVNVISYYDGGYNQCYCMLSSHQANGGIAAFNHVTHLKSKEFTLAPLAEFLEQAPDTNTLLCLFSGDQAEKFYSGISPLQKKYKLHLYVSPMLFEESLAHSEESGYTIQDVKGYVPWHPSLDNEANKLFSDQYAKKAGKPVNYFSLLGWDTGLLISEISKQVAAGNEAAKNIVHSLTAISFNSPRGWMKVDPLTHHSYGPSYLAECKGNMQMSIIGEAENMETEWNVFTRSNLPAGESSSWRNTYLCI